MATLKEQQETIFSLTGVDNFADAQNIVAEWRDKAIGTGGPSQADFDKLNHQLAEICKVAEAADYDSAVAGVTGIKNSITKLWDALGVKDEETAIAAIKTFKDDNAKSQREIADLKGAQEDFEKRVNAEVINRAASAGIQTPVKKPAGASTGGEGSNMMTRAEFNVLSPMQQTEFSKNGGKLSD